MQSAVGNGTRSSAATAYLQPVLERPNLDVVILTRVTRVFGQKDPWHIDSVEIATAADGEVYYLLDKFVLHMIQDLERLSELTRR